MLSYQHMYHAGCLADVQKHAALCLLLEALVQGSVPIHYIDTHAGRGLYDLRSPEATKTGEAAQGIVRLLRERALPAAHPYMRMLGAVQHAHGRSAYAGSPWSARHLLRQSDRLTLMELHPKEYDVLRQHFSAPHIHCLKQDGLEAALKITPSPDAHLFLLIDPSYELKSDYAALPDFIHAFLTLHPCATVLLWYPLLQDERHLPMTERCASLQAGDVWQQEVRFDPALRSRAVGSGLVGWNIPRQSLKELGNIKTLLESSAP